MSWGRDGWFRRTSRFASDVTTFCGESWISVYRAVYRSCSTKAEAEELVAGSLRPSACIDRSEQEACPRVAYVVRTAQNLVIDRWRANQRKPRLEALDESQVSA